MLSAVHLGDGAYITQLENGDAVLTANHHDPEKATDRVFIERSSFLALSIWLQIATQEKSNDS